MTRAIIESDIPMPPAKGSKPSPIRRMARDLHVGQCITLPAVDEEDQKEIAKRMNAMRAALKKDMPGTDYTLRRMFGEVDGRIVPVVRLWRIA